MDPHPQAPSVVAVVVASDPGAWLEDTLAALAEQDYPNLSVLVIDASDRGDPTPRVAAVLPDAYVRKAGGQPGFGAAANEALAAIEGAAFFLFCHDDAAPDADAVRQLVEEAMRSNAGIVGPKLVEWERPDRLADVGLSVDKLALAHSLVETGELDQEQHDAVRDVFAVPSAFVLVRSDLFDALGGFDPLMADEGRDIDLCWRAQVAGARVMVVPAARVRHLDVEYQTELERPEQPSIDARDRVRVLLKNYGFLHLLRVVPQALLASILEVVAGVFSGRRAYARAPLAAWSWNFRHLSDLRPARRKVQRSRQVEDADVRRLQSRASRFFRPTQRLGEDIEPEDRQGAFTTAGRSLVDALSTPTAREAALVWAGIAILLLVGSRHLFSGRFPSVGQLAAFPHRATLVFHNFVTGLPTAGLGSDAPAPAANGLLGLGGLLLLGRMSLLQRILLLGAWPLGVVGAWRWGRPLASTRPRLVVTVVYLAIPLAPNALARGRWPGLVAYAVAPWLLGALLRATGLPPFAAPGGGRRGAVLRFGLLLAVAGAFVPALAVASALVAVGILAGSLVVGGTRAALRAAGLAAGAVVVAAALLFPWSLQFLTPGREWATVAGAAPNPVHAPGLGALLRFHVGPVGAAPLGWAFVVAAAVPLVVGRGWRLAWAVRLWFVALVCVGAAWGAGRDWALSGVQFRDVVLAPAAMALAGAAGLGMAAFETDLPGYRFGWRQLAAVTGGVAAGFGLLPLLPAAASGRWRMPTNDLARSAQWMHTEAAHGSFRVLWVGDPDVLPGTGWRLGPGLAYSTSRNGPPDFTDLWPGSSNGPTRRVADALAIARQGRTTRLGHLLAPMAIRYVAVPRHLVPGQGRTADFPVPADLTTGLAAQLDLRQLPSDPAFVVYENTAWGPLRSVLRPGASTSAGRLGADLSGSKAVLPGRRPQVRYRGPVPAGQVFVSEASGRWRLTAVGHDAPRTRPFGWANGYRVDAPRRATLSYRAPLFRYGAVVLELIVWVIVARGVVRARRPGGATP